MEENPVWKKLKMNCSEEVSMYAMCAKSQPNILSCDTMKMAIQNCGIMNGLNIGDESIKEFVGSIVALK